MQLIQVECHENVQLILNVISMTYVKSTKKIDGPQLAGVYVKIRKIGVFV